MLCDVTPGGQVNLIGERLYPLVLRHEPAYAGPGNLHARIGGRIRNCIREWGRSFAGKITGMLLEMDITELLALLEDERALEDKASRALRGCISHMLARPLDICIPRMARPLGVCIPPMSDPALPAGPRGDERSARRRAGVCVGQCDVM